MTTKEKKLKIYPSDGAIWKECTAQPLNIKDYPYVRSDVAEIGKLLHEIAKKYLESDNEGFIENLPNDYPKQYLKVYNDFYKSLEGEKKLEIKIKTICGNGVVDLLAINKEKKEIHIADYKTGYVPVDVNDNVQLLIYAHAFIKFFDTFNIYIIQNGFISKKTYTKQQVIEKMAVVESAVDDILNNNVTFKAGEHCRYCVARLNCKTRDEYIKNMFETNILDEPINNLISLRAQAVSLDKDLKKEIERRVSENPDDAEKVTIVNSTYFSWNTNFEELPHDLQALLSERGVKVKNQILQSPKDLLDPNELIFYGNSKYIKKVDRQTIKAKKNIGI